VKNLFKVLSLLEKETEADCVTLHTFIKQMKSFCDLFELPQIAFADQIRMLAEVEEHFLHGAESLAGKRAVSLLNWNFKFQQHSSPSKELKPALAQHSLPSLIWGQMLLRTILVLCGQKSDIPIFFEYAYTSVRAWIELTKAFATDLPYPMHTHDWSKNQYYNNQKGVTFLMQDVPFVTPSAKKKTLKEMHTLNKGSSLFFQMLLISSKRISTGH
jgi:hypothetical protein